MKKPPNILYLHCHDAGRYVQPYGYPIKTPHLQRLAGEGVLFRDAHCANPTCSPSRACLLTGQSAHGNGMLGLAHRGWCLNDYSRTMMNFLRGHGYYTVLCGQEHIARPPLATPKDSGYSEILTEVTDFTSPPTLAEKFLESSGESPFFLDVGFFAPHRAGTIGDFPRMFAGEDDRYVSVPACLPDTPETRRDFSLYAASVRSVDVAMGRVLDALDRSGRRNDTLVICTTDHGIAFPGMKCALTSHGTGVMLLLRGPGGFEGGRVIDSLVSHLDLFPTICDLLDVEPPKWLEGQSILPLVQGEDAAEREAIFAEVNYHAAREPMRAVRTKRWLLIHRYSDHSRRVLPNIDDSLSKLYLFDNNFADRRYAEEELYDLVNDPQQSGNRVNDPAIQPVLKELRERLHGWMKETNDPLLDGSLPVADGMKDTPADAYSPEGGSEPDRTAMPNLVSRTGDSPGLQRAGDSKCGE